MTQPDAGVRFVNLSSMQGCLVQVGNGIELENVGLQG